MKKKQETLKGSKICKAPSTRHCFYPLDPVPAAFESEAVSTLDNLPAHRRAGMQEKYTINTHTPSNS